MLRFSFGCLRPHTWTSFHHQPEAQHPNSSAIHKLVGRLPHLCAISGLTYRSKSTPIRSPRRRGRAGDPETLRPMPLLGARLILEDQAEQEMHVAAVGSAFRRLGSIGSPHLAQVPYVPSDIRFRAASI